MKLTEAQKTAIVDVYNDGKRNVKQIAAFLKVSERTIGRVLKERGIASPMAARSAEAKEVMAILNKYNIDSGDLESIFQIKPLTPANVAIFLKESNQEQLIVILSAAGLIDTKPVNTSTELVEVKSNNG